MYVVGRILYFSEEIQPISCVSCGSCLLVLSPLCRSIGLSEYIGGMRYYSRLSIPPDPLRLPGRLLRLLSMAFGKKDHELV